MGFEELLLELKNLSDFRQFKALEFLLNEVDLENTDWQYQGIYSVKVSIERFLDNVEKKDFYINLETDFESKIKLDSNVMLFGEYLYRRQGGAEQFGHVKLEITSFVGESDFQLSWRVDEETIHPGFLGGVINGIKQWGEQNEIKGLSIKVVGGSHHEIDSREISFMIATIYALDDAFKNINLETS
jgi:hypothetical protein